jgi:hypothetical protein
MQKGAGRCLLIFCMIGGAEWADFCDQNGALFVAGITERFIIFNQKIK